MCNCKKMDKLKISLDAGAKMPTRAHALDAGLDLYARDMYTIPPRGAGIFDTGVHVEIPAGFAGLLVSKSGLNVNYGITSTGLIDSGYTGSITVKLYNHRDHPVYISEGQKISQLVIIPVETPSPVLVESIDGGERGNGGFGSTGEF